MRFILTLLLCLATEVAQAGMLLRLEKTGASVDFPVLTLTNDGLDSATGFSLTIGDESINFDSAQLEGTTNVDFELLSPDDLNGGLRSDVLIVSFLDFATGSLAFKLDLDRDIGAATVDWQQTLFNNGAVPNAIATVFWASGETTSLALPDAPSRNPDAPYELHFAAVPEPNAFFLMLVAAAGLLYVRWHVPSLKPAYIRMTQNPLPKRR